MSEQEKLKKAKTLFFAQYFGQAIIQWQGESLVINNTTLNEQLKEDYLLLRTVEQLTDEEVLIVAEMLTLDVETPYNIEFYRSEVLNYFNDETYFTRFNRSVSIIDYLRSIGILLPFTYLDENNKPQTLQPDEIIAKGWAKITN